MKHCLLTRCGCYVHELTAIMVTCTRWGPKIWIEEDFMRPHPSLSSYWQLVAGKVGTIFFSDATLMPMLLLMTPPMPMQITLTKLGG